MSSAACLMVMLSACARLVDTRCSGFSLGPEEWEYVEYLSTVAAENPLPRDAKEVLFEMLRQLESAKTLPEVIRSCPADALTLLAQSLVFIEKLQGEQIMLAALTQAIQAAKLSADGDLQLAWTEGIVKVMSGKADTEACSAPGALRVFVYDTGPLAERPLHCSAGMEGVEVFFHRFFLASSCRTDDPAAADLFFVPFYNFCYQNEHLTPGNETAELDELNTNLVRSLTHYSGGAKAKHLFLFPHEFWDFPSWRTLVSDSKFLVVEANPLEWSGPGGGAPPRHCLNCFLPLKDVVLPGHTDYWTTKQLVSLQKPWLDRQYSVCYHGAFSHNLYDEIESAAPFDITAGMSRAALAGISGMEIPGVSIGGHLRPVRSYYERITDCQFCIVPKGVGFTNGRLMETFFSGCIPVILSDAMVVPFDNFLPWPSFSLKLSMPRTIEDMLSIVKYLGALPASTGLKMHKGLAAHRCWFDYGPHARPDCSPYEGVVRQLLWQNRAASPRRFWSPEM